ncbi:MAG TPA: hypothetical protein VL346_06785 [Acidobacteriaceae bacterium]|nr:hypothetical protein [Acidobacteriaceae bacterium]
MELEKTPRASEVERLIQSDDPREMAWGAHYAEIKESPVTDAALLIAAGGWKPWDRSSRPYVRLSPEQLDLQDGMAAVLDALIRLHLAVPPETLYGLADDFPADVAILISRLPEEDAQEAELAFFRSRPANGYSLQYVSAALLAKSPPEGFAAELLAGIEVPANVYIRMPDEPGVGMGMSTGDCMGFGLEKRDGWPVFSSYAISYTKSQHALQILNAPEPVYATISDSSRYIDSSCGGPALGAGERRKLLAYMLRIKPEEIEWQTGLSRTIYYHSPQQVDAELRALIEEEQRKYRVTAGQLVEAGLMTEAQIEESFPVLDLRCHFSEEKLVKAPSPLPNRVRWELNPQGFF